MLAGAPGYEHRIVYDDGDHVAFLDKHPTLYGKLLVTPRAHVEDTIGGFTEEGYLALQRVVHQVAGALAKVVETERMYIMSLGSMQGNAHVHWHIAPLPPGVPYHEQQFYALDWSTRGRLQLADDEADHLAERLRAQLDRPVVGEEA
ncbi:HIT family protein [Streptacidiphilus sp. NEAU-YB345]|uniref:HIT family protein n=2 Tax=Streptacidiphilus fuscans TaxID=2789292 RepID=A0A931FFQ3_9ACTN|nr:HIT family protein [Streptacidiphilus fuscans]